MGIVVIGAVFVDIKGYPSMQYIAGGRNVGNVVQVHGGVSRNIAEDIANVELRPTFVGLVDETGIGIDVVDKLKNHKVNTKYIRKVKDGLGSWLAIFDNSGDVVASISKRPDLSEIARILDEQGDEIFKDADSIIIEFDMEKDILKRVFALAQKYDKKVYAVVSNMTIAVERRDLLKNCACFVCNQQEAGIFFSDVYDDMDPEQLREILVCKLKASQIPKMVITLGELGSVYATCDGESGYVKSRQVVVTDTTGAGDSFFAGVAIGLTYGKSFRESCEIGTRLAASVIATKENVCPRFLPEEFGIDASKIKDFE
ncbi:carbohydrate kinase family protein [Butyrivibrio fibrisolvens]|uniref:carbohydrate kinase family protein n=1 Tax=Butyrivibrio fibrisolvens TaxID=831 RepID=UPI0020BE5B16|nr:PfkB family carbohydrate kinase [Butyrivibrio fibrisolvens]